MDKTKREIISAIERRVEALDRDAKSLYQGNDGLPTGDDLISLQIMIMMAAEYRALIKEIESA